MTPETARWLLPLVLQQKQQAEYLLDLYFDVLPVEKRVELQLSQAKLEWMLDEILEQHYDQTFS